MQKKDMGYVRKNVIRIRREEKTSNITGSRICSGIILAITKIKNTAVPSTSLQGRLTQLTIKYCPTDRPLEKFLPRSSLLFSREVGIFWKVTEQADRHTVLYAILT